MSLAYPKNFSLPFLCFYIKDDYLIFDNNLLTHETSYNPSFEEELNLVYINSYFTKYDFKTSNKDIKLNPVHDVYNMRFALNTYKHHDEFIRHFRICLPYDKIRYIRAEDDTKQYLKSIYDILLSYKKEYGEEGGLIPLLTNEENSLTELHKNLLNLGKIKNLKHGNLLSVTFNKNPGKLFKPDIIKDSFNNDVYDFNGFCLEYNFDKSNVPIEDYVYFDLIDPIQALNVYDVTNFWANVAEVSKYLNRDYKSNK